MPSSSSVLALSCLFLFLLLWWLRWLWRPFRSTRVPVSLRWLLVPFLYFSLLLFYLCARWFFFSFLLALFVVRIFRSSSFLISVSVLPVSSVTSRWRFTAGPRPEQGRPLVSDWCSRPWPRSLGLGSKAPTVASASRRLKGRVQVVQGPHEPSTTKSGLLGYRSNPSG